MMDFAFVKGEFMLYINFILISSCQEEGKINFAIKLGSPSF